MIIVEGPDGSGKSRLAAQIAKQTGLRLAPRAVAGTGDIIKPLSKYVEEGLTPGGESMVYDRFALISEYIYASHAKRPPREKFGDIQWLSEMWTRFRIKEPVLIFCLPPRDVVWANCQRDEHNRRLFPREQSLYGVYHLYQALAAQFGNVSFAYDYTSEEDRRLLSTYLSIKDYEGVRL